MDLTNIENYLAGILYCSLIISSLLIIMFILKCTDYYKKNKNKKVSIINEKEKD